MKQAVEKQSPAEVKKHYPLDAGIEGWYFRLTETSNNAWLAEGTDLWGRKVSCQGSDEELLLKDCAEMARKVAAQVNP